MAGSHHCQLASSWGNESHGPEASIGHSRYYKIEIQDPNLGLQTGSWGRTELKDVIGNPGSDGTSCMTLKAWPCHRAVGHVCFR